MTPAIETPRDCCSPETRPGSRSSLPLDGVYFAFLKSLLLLPLLSSPRNGHTRAVFHGAPVSKMERSSSCRHKRPPRTFFDFPTLLLEANHALHVVRVRLLCCRSIFLGLAG